MFVNKEPLTCVLYTHRLTLNIQWTSAKRKLPRSLLIIFYSWLDCLLTDIFTSQNSNKRLVLDGRHSFIHTCTKCHNHPNSVCAPSTPSINFVRILACRNSFLCCAMWYVFILWFAHTYVYILWPCQSILRTCKSTNFALPYAHDKPNIYHFHRFSFDYGKVFFYVADDSPRHVS